MSVEAYFLIGPTASGKSDVAHILARRMSLPIISIDSMQVYKGLDIGTAKPTLEERSGLVYYGVDLLPPSDDFNVAAFADYVCKNLDGMPRRVIVCGGTGLYSKVLVEGLDDGPAPDRELRAKWEEAVAIGETDALKKELRRANPEVYAALKDSENPRRLIRALEFAKAGKHMDGKWGSVDAVMTGLDVPAEDLRVRIEERAERMFREGLVAETRGAVEQYGVFSRTAAQAIGYTEALAVIDGSTTEAEAVEKVKSRTRKLAKKQRTWFRHQSTVDWVPVQQGCSTEFLADKVEDSWNRNGPIPLRAKGIA